MKESFSLEENSIIKVWILLLPKREVKYLGQALVALLVWSGNHRLSIIKPCKIVLDLRGQLEWQVKHQEGEQLLFARALPPPLGISSECSGLSTPQL